METLDSGTRFTLRNILYLTDFSEPSETSLPFATAIARNYGANIHALHVLISRPRICATQTSVGFLRDAGEESAKAAMQRLESQLAGVPHDTFLAWGIGVWPTVEQAIKDHNIDLIVLGTHALAGAQEFLLGSVADEIFRHSPVPVLTIGPNVRGGLRNGACFHNVLFATDFSPEAREPQHPMPALSRSRTGCASCRCMSYRSVTLRKTTQRVELSVADAIHQLYEAVPKNVILDAPPEIAVEYGEPAARILETASQRGTHLIVLGIRAAAPRHSAATHLERATAHKVIAHADCPVLTIAHGAPS
jgi:nucleotide-binding universal stress UspA family protein